MVKEGVLQNPRPQAIFGLHAFSEMAVGDIGYSEGPALSASDTWEVKIVGRQSHGARPELSIDPVVTAAQFVQALQTIRSRSFAGHEPGVVTIGTIHGGQRHNIIPGEVTLTGTIRTFRPEMSTLAEARLRAILKGVTEAAGATGEVVRYARGAPATINDAALTRESVPSLERAVGKAHVTRDSAGDGVRGFLVLRERRAGLLLSSRPGEAGDDVGRSPHADVPGRRQLDSRRHQGDERRDSRLPHASQVNGGCEWVCSGISISRARFREHSDRAQSLEARVEHLERENERLATLLREVIGRLEKHVGVDLDKDGRVG